MSKAPVRISDISWNWDDLVIGELHSPSSTEPPLYWNNETRWGDLAGATHFIEADAANLDLPIGNCVRWLSCPVKKP